MKDEDVDSFEQLDRLLAEGKITDEEYNDLWSALKRRAKDIGTSGTPAPPDRKSDAYEKLSMWRKVALILVGLTQISFFVLSIAGMPLAPIGLGAASIIVYPLIPAQPKWIKRLTFVSALCGAGTITTTIISLS